MADLKEKQMIFTTKLVKEATDSINDGIVVKRYQNPWLKGEVGLRRAGVVFRMTPEEQEEYIKCALDIDYFVEKYCKVKREDGSVGNIKLRDYQAEILENFVNNRFNILMASRQVGKCFSFNTIISIEKAGLRYDIRLGKLYYSMVSKERKLSFLEKLKIKLYDWLFRLENVNQLDRKP
jgi:serine protease inhibitor ecotin